eukprot:Rhum_TRINITY_DN19366_c0_g1::Rhum_TRINITY_DN19366_c0_g1_i1::g.169896::m.169896
MDGFYYPTPSSAPIGPDAAGHDRVRAAVAEQRAKLGGFGGSVEPYATPSAPFLTPWTPDGPGAYAAAHTPSLPLQHAPQLTPLAAHPHHTRTPPSASTPVQTSRRRRYSPGAVGSHEGPLRLFSNAVVDEQPAPTPSPPTYESKPRLAPYERAGAAPPATTIAADDSAAEQPAAAPPTAEAATQATSPTPVLRVDPRGLLPRDESVVEAAETVFVGKEVTVPSEVVVRRHAGRFAHGNAAFAWVFERRSISEFCGAPAVVAALSGPKLEVCTLLFPHLLLHADLPTSLFARDAWRVQADGGGSKASAAAPAASAHEYADARPQRRPAPPFSDPGTPVNLSVAGGAAGRLPRVENWFGIDVIPVIKREAPVSVPTQQPPSRRGATGSSRASRSSGRPRPDELSQTAALALSQNAALVMENLFTQEQIQREGMMDAMRVGLQYK